MWLIQARAPRNNDISVVYQLSMRHRNLVGSTTIFLKFCGVWVCASQNSHFCGVVTVVHLLCTTEFQNGAPLMSLFLLVNTPYLFYFRTGEEHIYVAAAVVVE
jgi:hypothetical protein